MKEIQTLAYMKGDMAEGVAELVFDEEDLPHLTSIYPEITDYLEEKIADPEWLADLNERLEQKMESGIITTIVLHIKTEMDVVHI